MAIHFGVSRSMKTSTRAFLYRNGSNHDRTAAVFLFAACVFLAELAEDGTMEISARESHTDSGGESALRAVLPAALHNRVPPHLPISLISSRSEAMHLPIPGPLPGPVAPALGDFRPLQAPAQAAPLPFARIESPSASSWSLSASKRCFDVSAALLFLVLLAVPMLVIALCIRLSSPGQVLFMQNRLGRGGRMFGIYKFRSMVAGASDSKGITARGDLRITPLGRWMRRLKIDELPQLFNILRGDMSLVGPRPKLPRYEGIVNMPYRPGVTGAATLVFRCEEELLTQIHPSQVEVIYMQSIKPFKASLDVRYMSHATFWTDLRVIAATLVLCLKPARTPLVLPGEEKQLGTDSITA